MVSPSGYKCSGIWDNNRARVPSSLRARVFALAGSIVPRAICPDCTAFASLFFSDGYIAVDCVVLFFRCILRTYCNNKWIARETIIGKGKVYIGMIRHIAHL